MPAKCPYSTEYRVETLDGRILSWSAVDMDSLFRELHEKKIKAKNVRPFDEHEDVMDELFEEMKRSA